MEIVFLGTGTIYPDPGRRAPGLCLLTRGLKLVFDTGPGSWFRLTEAGVDFRKIDAIFYSHLHIDHVMDFPAYLFLTHNPEYGREKTLDVFAPHAFEHFYETLKGVFGGWLEPSGAEVRLHPLTRRLQSFDYKELTIASAHVRHSESSLAYRVDYGGKSFVYGGDLEYCDEIVELAEGCDLLVIESAFPEKEPKDGHLIPSQAGKIARRAGAGRLVLTHFYPQCKGEDMVGPARREFKGEVIQARDLMRLKV